VEVVTVVQPHFDSAHCRLVTEVGRLARRLALWLSDKDGNLALCSCLVFRVWRVRRDG
jgi:hypothetical protein